jgi:hypothetical protein
MTNIWSYLNTTSASEPHLVLAILSSQSISIIFQSILANDSPNSVLNRTEFLRASQNHPDGSKTRHLPLNDEVIFEALPNPS